jgi:hypothetical protein
MAKILLSRRVVVATTSRRDNKVQMIRPLKFYTNLKLFAGLTCD